MEQIKDTGIYVVCNDKSIMDRINHMFRTQGVIGMTDGEGNVHYMVDGRRSEKNMIQSLSRFIDNNTIGRNPDAGAGFFIRRDIADAVDRVFTEYGFDLSLMGTRSLMTITENMIYSEELSSCTLKELMSVAAKNTGTTYSQAERNIRYAIRKSDLGDSSLKTSSVIRLMTNESLRELRKRGEYEECEDCEVWDNPD